MSRHKPSIGWMIKGLGPGGAERLLLDQCRLLSRDYAIHIGFVTPEKNHLAKPLRELGASVTLLPKIAERNELVVAKVKPWIARKQIRLIHSHSPQMAAWVRLQRRFNRIPEIPLIYTEHNTWGKHHPLTRIANSLTIGMEDHVICVSEGPRKSVLTKRSQAEKLIHGVSIEVDGLAPNIHKDKFVIGMMANFRKEKNHEFVLSVASKLQKENYSSIHFALYGQGPLLEEIQQKAKDLELSNLTIYGYTDTPHDVMQSFDAIFQPSFHEGFPLSLMEAVKLSVIPIVSPLEGIKDVLGDGAIYVSNTDVWETANTLKAVADGSHQRIQETRAKGKELRHLFDPSNSCNRIREIYQEALA